MTWRMLNIPGGRYVIVTEPGREWTYKAEDGEQAIDVLRRVKDEHLASALMLQARAERVERAIRMIEYEQQTKEEP